MVMAKSRHQRTILGGKYEHRAASESNTESRLTRATARRLSHQVPMLQVLATAAPDMRAAIINKADRALLRTLCECSKTVTDGLHPISPRCRHVLKRHRFALRRLAEPVHKVSFSEKRRILASRGVQRGGFLGVLIGSLLPSLIQGIGSLLAKRPT